MGWRFRRSIRLMPGVRVNLGLTRASLSVGPRGLTCNIGSKGSRVTVGLPGTGISYTQTVSQQNPVTLIANSIPQRRQYSATAIVIVAFVFGLLYLVLHPTTSQVPSVTEPASNEPYFVSSTGADLNGPKISVTDPTIPLPRPRPKFASDPIGPPLQIVPK
jgi:Protein of unknown function (DUF4236)